MSSTNNGALEAALSSAADERPSGLESANGVFEKVSDSSASDKKVAHGFHMQVQSTNRKRKRDSGSPRPEASSFSLSSSSSSSSDEDDETKRDDRGLNPALHHRQQVEEKEGQHDDEQQKDGDVNDEHPAENIVDPAESVAKGPQEHQHHSVQQQNHQPLPEGWRDGQT